jgi:hypothetical protein
VERLQVRVHTEVLLAGGTALLILDGGVEDAQSVDLHALALKQHLEQTRLKLLHDAFYNVLGEY